MSYNIDRKTGEIIIQGFDKGIAVSPLKGIANIQNGNLSTESGEVLCSFARIQQTQTNDTNVGTLTPSSTSHLDVTLTGSLTFKAGIWIHIESDSGPGLSGYYYVLSSAGAVNTGIASITLSQTFSGSAVSFTNSGTSTFSITTNVGMGEDYAVEYYHDSSGAQQYRYYILDSNGLVWVNDTAVSVTGATWVCPDRTALTGATGLEVLDGWLFAFGAIPSTGFNSIVCKSTVWLAGGTSASGNINGWNNISRGTNLNPNVGHFAYSGHQGTILYCDGQFLGSIFPNSSIDSLLAGNIQSFSSYTAVTTTGTITDLISGSLPVSTNGSGVIQPIPAVFFTVNGGTIPSALTANKLYWIKMNAGALTFKVYSSQANAISNTSPIDIATGASGTQYFNTFYPVGAVSAGNGSDTWVYTPQKLNLPSFETSTSIVEVGDTVVVGGKTNGLYAWNQVDIVYNSLIELPEDDVHYMIAVNNMAYIFAGHKGNIYITNGSTASLVMSIPDYCAGVPGNEASYIEPYFSWGGADYIRGRVYFSIQDQTASKAGNCGGVWSFVPTQNFFVGQDVGLALKLENQSSYATYNGLSTLIIGSQNQTAIGVQYFSAWTSDINTPKYGIDNSGTNTLSSTIVESDLIPTGTFLEKKTFQQIEYKVSAPLVAGETLSVKYRQNSTDAWTLVGTFIVESTTGLSGYVPVSFERGQWLQLQMTLSPLTSPSGSFIRLTQVKVI
jgi:hypothetical protein